MISITSDAIADAVRTLDQGGILAMPTDTVYGLAAAADNRKALARLLAAKGRPASKPIVVMVADQAAAMRLVTFPQAAKTLAEAFWPGALTLVLPWPANLAISTAVTAGLPTIGLRVPNHPATLAILKAFGRPLAVTSANRSGAPNVDEAWQIEATLGDQVDLVLDGGAAPAGIESTIIEITQGRLKLLRSGAVETKKIAATLGLEASDIVT